MDHHQLTAVFSGGLSFTSDINGHKLITDTQVNAGGGDSGPSPKRLMLASLAGCTGIDVVSILNKMKVDFSNFSIHISATLTTEHPKVYDEVTVTYNINVTVADRVKMQKAVKLSAEKYCGVSRMFSAFATVHHHINFA